MMYAAVTLVYFADPFPEIVDESEKRHMEGKHYAMQYMRFWYSNT